MIPVATELLLQVSSGTNTTPPEPREQIIADAAAWAATMVGSRGVTLDGSVESLRILDMLVDDARDAIQGEPNAPQAALLWALGAYLGEVLRNARGGSWSVGAFDDLDQFWGTSLTYADGLQVWPMQRLIKRFLNGPDDAIYAYGVAMTKLSDD
ncbi:hypothetical protein [Roseiterribacter gracilis]|uniref:DUF3806 domain-containing protein n=1 Tax=Roseiterribacter gracilis TaxID=2812848 RepID=A0A8S8X923_9PROT|nr:hypothetical protein TMPK1_06380 [Rhodospirillales bacterium TMPK1]